MAEPLADSKVVLWVACLVARSAVHWAVMTAMKKAAKTVEW